MAKIKVALRVRPRSIREVTLGYPVVVGVDENSAFITDIKVPERPSADSRQRFRHFDFDHAFWLSDEGEEGACQEEVYAEMGTSLEESILEGYNACLLAYGQSSTGKTHTMLGTKDDPGLILRLCQGLWKKFKTHCSTASKTFRMEVSFMEIYREKVRDLLAPSENPLKLREHPQLGPHVQGLKRIEINESLSILDLLWEGEKRRATGATGSNRHSSRSHAIWTIYLTSTRKNEDGSELITRNQAHLVDLAGSERADLATTKHRLAEGKDINRSLVSLGNVISSLAERAQYIPYRDSTLTWFLKDSLGGNATTAIIITASPSSSCHAQTLNSLRFAQRARLVENQPKINVTKYEGRPKKRNGEKPGIFSGISTFDLKKDIGRLASMIRSAQTNGGVLRGLTPSTGWNRLISAIENWSHLDSEQEQDGRAKQNQSTSMETLTTTSVADGQVQVDLKSDSSTETSESSRPSPSKPVNDVFIPMSNSFKCLTWHQQEIQQIPSISKPSSDDVYISPSTSPKVNHLKHLVPLYFPVMHKVESEGRIGERIHGTVEKLREPEQILPNEVRHDFQDSPLIRDKFPALVNPQSIAHPLTETCSPLWDENLNYVKSVGVKGQESLYSFNIPHVSEFTPQAHSPLPVFQNEVDDDSVPCHRCENKTSRSFRSGRAKILSYETEQNDTGIDPGNSYSDSLISSSSYESLQLLKTPKRPVPLKIVSRGDFNFTEIEEKLESLPFSSNHQVASVSHLEDLTQSRRRQSSSSPEIKVPHHRRSPSKFSKFFRRELTELENIGKQLQNLKQKTDRYQRLKPYLTKLEELNLVNHSVPDPVIDSEIEQCSGWNIGIEFQKVEMELSAINKILQRGPSAKPTASESSLSNPESSGSISLETSSHRSSNASISNFDFDGNFYPKLESRLNPGSKSAPVLTSTPKMHPNSQQPHVSSTFWSDFYKKMGPRGDGGDQRKFSGIESDLDQRQGQRWRPFLPKTHSYLCHQNGFAYPPPNTKNYPDVYHYRSSPNFPPQGLQQQQKQMQTFHRRQHLHSLSSEGSSPRESSQSDQYCSPGCHYGSPELCSCQDSLDSHASHWDSFDNDSANYSYRPGHQYSTRNELNYSHDMYLNTNRYSGNRHINESKRCSKY